MKLKKQYSIVIIDSNKLKIRYLSSMINMLYQKVKLIGTENTLESGIKLIESKKPDIVILDMNLKDQKGKSFLERFNNLNFEVIINEDDDFYRLDFEKSVKAGYIMKKIDFFELFV